MAISGKQLVKALMKPTAYPHPTAGIRLIETHISYVFLTGDYVYKVKKPVKFSFLDFSSLKKRRLYCEREVSMNRELCPRQVYVDVSAITENGGLMVDGKGRAREYAVKMKQFSGESKMVKMLKKGKVGYKHLDNIAKQVANFHKRTQVMKRAGTPNRVREVCFDLESVVPILGYESREAQLIQRILEKTDEFLQKNRQLFEKRVDQNKIRLCHGDLHTNNIFILSPDEIYIVDRIEFNNEIASCDVMADVAFLAMDLDFSGFEQFSNYFVKKYVEFSGDKEGLKLLNFYKSYRANVRAKVAALSLAQDISKKDKNAALKLCRKYLKLADGHKF